MGKRTLNIKNLVPRKNAATRQGYYILTNPQKYIGDPSKIIYRSGWENRFCIYCDTNDKILNWSSEPLVVPYINPITGEVKPYNVDFYVRVQTTPEKIDQYIVEVKPAKQLLRPVHPTGRITEKRMTAYTEQMKTYLINLSKFNSAKEFAKAKGWEFIIVTEHMLFP